MSDARNTANARNAQKSTGPRTSSGKAHSRLNGLRHGLRAEIVVLPDIERAKEWEEHRAHLGDALRPQNYLEDLLVDRVALATWRLRRAARAEQAHVAHRLDRAAGEAGLDTLMARPGREPRDAAACERNFTMSHSVPSDELLARYETSAERSFHRALETLRLLRENLGSVGKSHDVE